jgi:hypothetical protein
MPTTDRGLSALLALLVVLIFVMQPLAEIGIAGRLVTSVFFTLMQVSGVWAVAGNRSSAMVVGALVLTSLTVRWVRIFSGKGSLVMASVLAHVFCIVVAAIVLAQVFREGRITFHRVRGAVAAYLLIGMAWAFAYEAVALEWPGAFAFPDARTLQAEELIAPLAYFSFVTLTTVGYGDVTARHPIARSLVTIEALIGQLFPAILLARLVSLELLHRDRDVADEEIQR